MLTVRTSGICLECVFCHLLPVSVTMLKCIDGVRSKNGLGVQQGVRAVSQSSGITGRNCFSQLRCLRGERCTYDFLIFFFISRMRRACPRGQLMP